MLQTISTGLATVRIDARVRKVGVYLDNFALISFAKGKAERRARLIGALSNGADLMFSPTNAAEIVGPECQSSIDAIRAFLDEVGPHWFPLESVKILDVLEREAKDAEPGAACISDWFLNQYFAARNIQLHGEQRFDLVDSDFFRLSVVLDWVASQRDNMRRMSADFEDNLRANVMQLRRSYEANRKGFGAIYPSRKYNPRKPATFVWHALLWQLMMEARSFHLKKGDGHDFFHSVMASAYARFATLDRHWKRRIETLPKPNDLAKIYYQPELDALLDHLEAEVAR